MVDRRFDLYFSIYRNLFYRIMGLKITKPKRKMFGRTCGIKLPDDLMSIGLDLDGRHRDEGFALC